MNSKPKNPRSYPLCWPLVLFASQLLMLPARAIDIGHEEPAKQIVDQSISIGRRTMMLPGGDWTLVAKTKGAINLMNNQVGSAVTHYTGYAMNVKDGKMLAGVQLRLPVNSTTMTGWKEEPCKVEGAIFKDDFGGSFTKPECLVVFKRRSHLATSTEGIYGEARQWANTHAVKLPGPVYEVAYTKMATNDFGVIRIFIPQTAMASDEQAVSWAKLLPEALGPLFANSVNSRALPSIPLQK